MAAQTCLSYSSQDRESVVALASYLEGRGLNVGYDSEIEAGDRYATDIEKARSENVRDNVVMTPASSASSWVEREMENAERQDKKIFALLLHGRPSSASQPCGGPTSRTKSFHQRRVCRGAAHLG